MRKTIRFFVTPELTWAATAYVRRNALVFRIVLISTAVVAVAAYLLLGDRISPIVGSILLIVSIYVSVLFIRAQSVIMRANNRKQDQAPIMTQITFTDDGFRYDEVKPERFVRWTDVIRVRETQEFCALHYISDGREAFNVIPATAIDGELSALILRRATEAAAKRRSKRSKMKMFKISSDDR